MAGDGHTPGAGCKAGAMLLNAHAGITVIREVRPQ